MADEDAAPRDERSDDEREKTDGDDDDGECVCVCVINPKSFGKLI